MEKLHSDTDSAERFEVSFNRIHGVLKRLNPSERNDAFINLLSLSSRKHPYVKLFYSDLRQYAKLRNAIVHEKLSKRTYIALPNENVVLHIEKMAGLLTSPPSVLTLATKSVVTFNEHQPIEQVIKTIDTYPYNQFPVYQNGVFSFLLTEAGLTSWIARNIKSSSIHFSGCTAGDIKQYEKQHNVAFVSHKMNVLEVEDLFEESFQHKRKLEAVIVTDQGNFCEKPLGIITSWDLIEINILHT